MEQDAIETPRENRRTIFELLQTYNRSLENMRAWLDDSGLDEVERIGIADAWQADMVAWFRQHGYCFACNRPLNRCRCGGVPPQR